tara:strand:- start:700 stop:954 length:255 start_codon:yes stop_codon:yes gene_type:complete
MAMEKHPNDNWNKSGEYVKPGSGHLTKSGKAEILKLFKNGTGTLSIAVRLGLRHRKVKEYLRNINLLEREEYVIKGLNEQWIGT